MCAEIECVLMCTFFDNHSCQLTLVLSSLPRVHDTSMWSKLFDLLLNAPDHDQLPLYDILQPLDIKLKLTRDCFVTKSSTARSFSRLTSTLAPTEKLCLKVVAYTSIMIMLPLVFVDVVRVCNCVPVNCQL